MISTIWNNKKLVTPLGSASALINFLNQNNYIWTSNKQKEKLIISIVFEENIIELEIQ